MAHLCSLLSSSRSVVHHSIFLQKREAMEGFPSICEHTQVSECASPSRPSCEPLFGRFSLSYAHLVVIIILSVYIWVTYPWYWSLKYCIPLWFALTLTPQPEWSVSVFKTVCIRCKHCQHCRGVFSSAFSLCEKSCSYFLWLPFSKKPANMPPERSGGSE